MKYPADEQMRLERARKKVEAIKGFYKHLAVYVVVNMVFLLINAFNTGLDDTFFTLGNFSMALFWGIGLAVHALGVFGTNLFLSSNWEERKIRELMEREKQRRGSWE